MLKSRNLLSSKPGFISSSKITLTFGAFMNLAVTVLLDTSVNMKKGILAEYAIGRSKEEAVNKALEKINRALPSEARVVNFEVGTYTTPVTRRTYAVGVVVYNVPLEKRPFREFTIKERRELLANVLGMFNYNPRVLNISEIARIFGVSRDSIYYDIEQILKEKKVSQ
ncbi:hypothetical protein [Thermococcus sp. CX2]|uniref:hypothetical protein n=1 Tax=Thermococcus sp. CX2 TaxID=163006 RepID=UPI0035305054